MALVTRAEVVSFAKITGTLTTDQNNIIDNFIAAAVPELERVVGPIETATRTYTTGSRSGALVLPWRFASITSVTVDGVAVSAADYDAVSGAASGILNPANGYAPWSYGTSVVVTAVVGSASTPANVKLAALELCAYLWQSTQQGQRSAWQDGGVPVGFAMPQRVLDHLAPAPDLPGFA
jgi:hypothetical protein